MMRKGDPGDAQRFVYELPDEGQDFSEAEPFFDPV